MKSINETFEPLSKDEQNLLRGGYTVTTPEDPDPIDPVVENTNCNVFKPVEGVDYKNTNCGTCTCDWNPEAPGD